MESEAAPLRHTKDHIFGANVQPENLFEVHAGDFWSMFETRNCMRAHLALADEIHDEIAVVYDTKAAWEVVVWHYQEMLRLCSGDSLGLRYRFPFLLMQPNRDDDAFCFLRYWMQGDENYVRKRELHKNLHQAIGSTATKRTLVMRISSTSAQMANGKTYTWPC